MANANALFAVTVEDVTCFSHVFITQRLIAIVFQNLTQISPDEFFSCFSIDFLKRFGNCRNILRTRI